ncbi:hypothetical protein KDA14_05660 [Candidatus Saccharibacteria bacterium]|nr:hypothetical protein [Candidatus Saccharibacteria bacterium]
MSHIEAFLGEQVHLDSRLSFGFDVANAYKANDESYIWLAKRLARRAGELLYSEDTVDQIAVSHINSSYRYEAHTAIAERLHNKLDTRLTDKPLHWLQYATERDIALFAIANRDLHREHQAALDRDYPQIVEKVLEGVESLVKASYYPREAMSVYAETIDRYGRWKAIDPFEGGARNLGGYCTAQVIALTNSYTNPATFTGIGQHFLGKAAHELSHGIDFHEGRGFNFISANSYHYEYFSFLGEAMAEHNAIANENARDHQFNLRSIDPTRQIDRYHVSPHYEKERILCGALGLDPAQLAEVQISTMLTRKGRRLRADVLAQMSHVFGSEQDTFNFVHTYDETPYHDRNKFINEWLDFLSKKSGRRPEKPSVRPFWRRMIAAR